MKLFTKTVFLSDLIPPIIPKLIEFIKIKLHCLEKDSAGGPKQLYSAPLLCSYSQFNEDLIVDYLLSFKEDGFFVDVGANDPCFNSNSKRFYDRGWSGINVEPGIESFRKIESARKRDINLNVGVCSNPGKKKFYNVVGDSTLSSFDKKVATRMAKNYGLTLEVHDVEVYSLSDIFKRYANNKKIDFMSIDAEGYDIQVLNSNDWSKYRPSIVMVEIDYQCREILELMKNNGYLLMYNNFHNGIFLDRHTSDATLRKFL